MSDCGGDIFNALLEKTAPLYEDGDRQKFFPVEFVACIIEVKSTLTKTNLRIALNKLSEIKKSGENLLHSTINNLGINRDFNPSCHFYDRLPTVLVCNDLDFGRSRGIDGIENEIDDLYEDCI